MAQLAHVPARFGRTITVSLPPCASRRRERRVVPQPSPADDISFRILSEIRYAGRAGMLTVVTARPSPAALRPGLNLGSRIGALPDGNRLFNAPCAGDCPGNDILWLRHALIISLSGNLPLGRLHALAVDVVVK